MNLERYLLEKEKKKRQQELVFQSFRAKCFQCFWPKKHCFCQELQKIKTNVHFKILMHPKEAKKESITTGRFSNIILENCEIIIDASFDQNKRVKEILSDQSMETYLLYPGSNSLNLSKGELVPSLKKELNFIILDGTWPCAKSMMRDSTILHTLPRVSFDSRFESQFSIKHQPARFCLSTIESIYHVIEDLKEVGIEGEKLNSQELLNALKKVVDFQTQCANDPNLESYKRVKKPFKKPSTRKDNKKWLKRSIVYLQ